MTVIRLHGILKKEFGETFNMSIRRAKEVIDAISANKPAFKNRINELSQQGIHYSIVVDGEAIQTQEQYKAATSPCIVDLVPVICGYGAVAVGVVGAGLIWGGVVAGGATFVGAAVIGSMLVSAGVAALGMALQMAMAPKPEMKRTESTISGAKQSFMLSSKANLLEQGNPVPVGYGRLRVGSSVIQATVKSYPQTQKTRDALIGDGKPNGVATSLR